MYYAKYLNDSTAQDCLDYVEFVTRISLETVVYGQKKNILGARL